MGKQHYMTEFERYKLEAYLDAKKPVSWIAKTMGFCRQSIYNEIEVGSYLHNCGYKDEKRYSAARAQDIHRKAQQAKGRNLKIGNDHEFARFIEHMVLKEKYSPAAALAEARKEGHKTTVCVTTLYSYITKHVFFNLTDADLPEKPKRKKRTRSERKLAHPKLPSIEERPQVINDREELGHWEMDLVVSCQQKPAALLTLTERKNSEETIIKVKDKKAATIRAAIDELERKTPNFKDKYKSITTDNGVEFLEYDKLIQSIDGGKRFDIYYCHSYAAWEKGSNENHNRMIRRFFPKGTDFSQVSEEEIQKVMDWMNNYLRKRLGWLTPLEAASVTH